MGFIWLQTNNIEAKLSMEELKERVSIKMAKDMWKEFLKIIFRSAIVFKGVLAILFKETIQMVNGVKENLHLT